MDDHIRAREEAGDLVRACQDNAKDHIAAAASDPEKTMAAMDELLSCVEEGVAFTLAKANEEIAFHSKIRRGLAEKMEVSPLAASSFSMFAMPTIGIHRFFLCGWYSFFLFQFKNYTCVDGNLTSSEAIESKMWSNKHEPARKVDIMFERPASRIHVVHDFIDAEECRAMEAAAKHSLHRGTSFFAALRPGS